MTYVPNPRMQQPALAYQRKRKISLCLNDIERTNVERYLFLDRELGLVRRHNRPVQYDTSTTLMNDYSTGRLCTGTGQELLETRYHRSTIRCVSSQTQE